MFGWNRRSTSQPEEPNMLGLISILGCDNPHRRGDIIFVHGLAGHAWSTWHPQNQRNREDSEFWPAWLGEELKEKNLDVGIWSFGYEAARFQFSGSAMARFDQASNLLEYLEVNDIGERPIIFVTHSMGGLLVKEMIRTAQNFNKQKIIQQIKGIVFLSTPHTGAHLAKLIDNIGILVRPTVNVEELKAHTPELRNLNEWYRQNVENLGIVTKVFYETKPISGILVVDEDSANPSIKDVKPVAMAEDHNSIAKPSSKNNLVYLSVKKLVIEHLKPLPQLPPANSIPLEISSSEENQKLFKETANAVPPGDHDAIETITRPTRISHTPESSPQAQQSPQLTRGISNRSRGGSLPPLTVSAMNNSNNLEKLISEFRNSRDRGKWIIPVCGAGFSKHIINQNCKLPSWEQLADNLLKEIDSSTEQDGIDIALQAKDYLTALTLIQKCNPKQFGEYLQAQFQNEEMKQLKQKSLPLHMSLWSIGFPLIVTTNFDALLEKARPRAEVYTYQSKNPDKVIEEALNGNNLKPVIFHAHGRITDDNSPDVPLLTWREYFQAYGINDLKKDILVSILTSSAAENFTKNSERERYKEVLENVLKEAWESISPTRADQAGTRLPDILDDLLTKHTLLLIGFSLDDPFWKVDLKTILSKYPTYPNWNHYYVTRHPNKSAPAPGFNPITLKDWNKLYSILNTLAVGIYNEKDSEGKYIKGGTENEARNREAKYLSLREKYQTLKWIFEDKDSVVPFVELWSNKTFGRVEIVVEAVNEKTWHLDTEMENLRDEYWQYRQEKSLKKGISLSNERKVRVSSWREIENGICLSVEPVEYKDYLITNHMVANVVDSELSDIAKYNSSLRQRIRRYFSESGDFNPRNFLCRNEREIALDSRSKCSNHLGVSALIIGNFEAYTGYKIPVIFCPPSTRQISSPNDIIPSVSGSVDWPVKRNANSEADIYSLEDLRDNPELLNIDKELKREFIEECRWDLIESIEQRSFGYKHHVVIDRHADYEINELMSNQVLINLCQNIERGGKPELFYLFTLKEEISMNSFLEDYFQPNWELDKLWTPILDEANTDYLVGPPGLLKIFLLPSPIDIKLNIDDTGYRKAFEVIYAILNNPGYNPVLRAHLASLLLFCKRICKRNFPAIYEEVVTTLAPDLAD